MTRIRAAAAAVLIATPTVLAFSSGGYFDHAREVALIVVWALAVVAALTTRRRPGVHLLVACAALALLSGWVALSGGWAPQADRAAAELQLVLLYLGALGAAAVLLPPRAVEPALAAGIAIVIGEGLAGRLLPGLVSVHADVSAGGRLDQPLTYWNATGALAAMGVVLCVRLAGDAARGRATRALGAAGAVPLTMATYLSFSRGALAALGVGLLVLVALAPQLRAMIAALVPAAIATAVAASSGAVASLDGTLATRERDGAIVFAVMVVAMVAAALLAPRMDGAQRRRSLAYAPLAAVVLAAAAIVAGASGGGPARPGAHASRLESVGSNRYRYWDVALHATAQHPLRGLGAGGFAAYWLRHRTIDESVLDAHSLELQTLAEEGIPGLVLLLVAFAAVALAAREAWRRDPALAAGPAAALSVWLLHSAIDWDWEMPALTLVAVLLAGSLIALAAPDARLTRSGSRRRAWRSAVR